VALNHDFGVSVAALESLLPSASLVSLDLIHGFEDPCR
jgi:hypothetical protein